MENSPLPQGGDRLYASLLSVAASPHIKSKESIARIMWTVNITLIPVMVWGVYTFGLRALMQMLVCTGASMACEAAIQNFRGVRASWHDGSAFLTGLLLAFCIPVGLPLWMSALGCVFAIGVAKHAFGGLGQNIFNPAYTGRAFLLASFPLHMTTWTSMKTLAVDAVNGITSATPLGLLKEGGMAKVIETFGSTTEVYKTLWWGNPNGCMGEAAAPLILLGGLYLIYKRYIFWQGPFFYLATVALLTWAMGGQGWFDGDPLFHLLTGGLMISAFYMITDMVTSPITRKGQIVFAIGAGILVFVIRKYGGYPEGVCYSVLLMNCATPLIDRIFAKR